MGSGQDSGVKTQVQTTALDGVSTNHRAFEEMLSIVEKGQKQAVHMLLRNS